MNGDTPHCHIKYSIAMLLKHMAGNMRTVDSMRFTWFTALVAGLVYTSFDAVRAEAEAEKAASYFIK